MGSPLRFEDLRLATRGRGDLIGFVLIGWCLRPIMKLGGGVCIKESKLWQMDGAWRLF